MRELSVPRSLKKLYSKLLGERDRILAPPKRLLRREADRATYVAEEDDRSSRLKQIDEALPHVAFVIGMLDSSWDPTTAKATRSYEIKDGAPPEGFISAAMAVLWEATEPLTMAEIAQISANKIGYELDDVEKRQRYHRSVNTSLMHSKDELVGYKDRYPNRWALRSRGFSEDKEYPD